MGPLYQQWPAVPTPGARHCQSAAARRPSAPTFVVPPPALGGRAEVDVRRGRCHTKSCFSRGALYLVRPSLAWATRSMLRGMPCSPVIGKDLLGVARQVLARRQLGPLRTGSSWFNTPNGAVVRRLTQVCNTPKQAAWYRHKWLLLKP